jgi:hypothetical protein
MKSKVTPDNLLECFVALKLYVYTLRSTTGNVYFVYENLSEEGAGVTKRLWKGDSEAEAKEVLAKARESKVEELKKCLKITWVSGQDS